METVDHQSILDTSLVDRFSFSITNPLYTKQYAVSFKEGILTTDLKYTFSRSPSLMR